MPYRAEEWGQDCALSKCGYGSAVPRPPWCHGLMHATEETASPRSQGGGYSPCCLWGWGLPLVPTPKVLPRASLHPIVPHPKREGGTTCYPGLRLAPAVQFHLQGLSCIRLFSSSQRHAIKTQALGKGFDFTGWAASRCRPLTLVQSSDNWLGKGAGGHLCFPLPCSWAPPASFSGQVCSPVVSCLTYKLP